MTATTPKAPPVHLTPHAARLGEGLRRLTDAQLEEVMQHLYPEGREPASTEVARVILQLGDFVIAEKVHRAQVIYNATSELMGGHRVKVTRDFEVMHMWQAYCQPIWDDANGIGPCWVGPPRATQSEAIEDGRAHHPGYTPEVS